MISNKANQKIYILMSFAMLTWAIAWTSAKILNRYLDFYDLTFLRFFFGFISLLPFIIKQSFNNIFSLNNIKYIVLTSILFFIYNICFFKATFYGDAGKGAVLVTTINPIFTFLISSILARQISKNELIGILFGLIGGLLILNVFNEGISNIIHSKNIYFVICGFIWGIMTVLMSKAQQNIGSLQFIFLCYLLTTFISLPFISFDSKIFLLNFDSKFFINFFFVSIGAMSFGTSIYIYATPILGPVRASVFIFSVPLLALSIAYFFLNEPIRIEVICGGIMSLFGIYIVNRTPSFNKSKLKKE